MTAAVKPTDPLAEQKERLRRAAWDLEDVADRAREAVESLMPEDEKLPAPGSRLHDAIERMHADEHDGPMRWCKHPVCVEAQA